MTDLAHDELRLPTDRYVADLPGRPELHFGYDLGGNPRPRAQVAGQTLVTSLPLSRLGR